MKKSENLINYYSEYVECKESISLSINDEIRELIDTKLMIQNNSRVPLSGI